MKKIWHPYWKWECFKSGFYSDFKDIKLTKEECEQEYKKFLSNLPLFEKILKKVITKWNYSCEHFLTDSSRNKIAWLGQASMAYYKKIPAKARAGYKLLSNKQQKLADNLAKKYLKKYLKMKKMELKNGFKKNKHIY